MVDSPVQRSGWVKLSQFRDRLAGNLAALQARAPDLTARLLSHVSTKDYVVSTAGERVNIAVAGPPGTPFEPMPNPVTAAGAAQIIARLQGTPGGLPGPILIAGLDQGWLWDAASKLKTEVPAAPGHRPPVYFLSRDFERFWLVLHLHDWRTLLSDRRCIFFVGEDCVAQLERQMVECPHVAWPRINVTVDAAVWPEGENLDSLLSRAGAAVETRTMALVRRVDSIYASRTLSSLSTRMRAGPLRVLGITSLYTTFLQHSMRDWLAGMASLGHETRLLIEEYDHQRPHPARYLQAIADFQPDLLLLIDHYRTEFPLLPPTVPSVMWVQDRLPNIFRTAAGAAQGPMDYVIGYGRRDCVTDFCYPRSRFMESPVGVNESRFAADVPEVELQRHASTIAFVSHASRTPQELVQEQITLQPAGRGLMTELFERLNAIYAGGGYVTQEYHLRQIAQEALSASKTTLESIQPLMEFVTQRLNNAFFRHQVLHWLVDAGYEPALYGNGWEKHPRFGRFSRGSACNQRELAAIYRAAQINLQVTPFGSAHQRLFEGLCAGAFFLLRKVTGDDVEPMYVQLWDFCRKRNISTDRDLQQRAGEQVHATLDRIAELTGEHPLRQGIDFTDALRAAADGGFVRTSSTLWGEAYAKVAFETRDQLLAKVRHYLSHPEERAEQAEAMRQRVLQTVTYPGISRRLIRFIADDLAGRSETLEAAA